MHKRNKNKILIIAAIVADGTTELTGVQFIDRGYENIEEKFRDLGAKIERITESD